MKLEACSRFQALWASSNTANLFYGDLFVPYILIPEMMDILDKAAHFTLSHRLFDSLTSNFVACERLTKYIDERAVAGQEDGMFIGVFIRAPCCDI